MTRRAADGTGRAGLRQLAGNPGSRSDFAIRVAPWAGPFDPDRPETEFLIQLARDLTARR
ncbi:MAG: hypothetical protein MZV65_13695 [Chromatiales bacterium]|nr:hypothetical protein [Chromatiales bacterium]